MSKSTDIDINGAGCHDSQCIIKFRSRKLALLNAKKTELKQRIQELEKHIAIINKELWPINDEIYKHEIENLANHEIAIVNAWYHKAEKLVYDWKGYDQTVKKTEVQFNYGLGDINYQQRYEYDIYTDEDDISFHWNEFSNESMEHGVFYFRFEHFPYELVEEVTGEIKVPAYLIIKQ